MQDRLLLGHLFTKAGNIFAVTLLLELLIKAKAIVVRHLYRYSKYYRSYSPAFSQHMMTIKQLDEFLLYWFGRE